MWIILFHVEKRSIVYMHFRDIDPGGGQNENIEVWQTYHIAPSHVKINNFDCGKKKNRRWSVMHRVNQTFQNIKNMLMLTL